MTKHLIVTCIILASVSCKAYASTEEPTKAATATITYQELEASEGDKAFLADDFNKDSHVDLVVAEEQNNRIVLFLNDGDGTLTRSASFPAGQWPSWLTSLDFNRDGNLDVAVANHETDTVTLLQGTGDGSFTQPQPSSILIETAPHSHMIKAADMDIDGIPDLVIDSRDRFGVYVLRTSAAGSFDAPGTGIDVGGSPYHGFAVGDINNDSKPDIVTPNQNDVSVLLNQSQTSIAFEQAARVPVQSPFAVDVADLNGDGNLDLVVASVRQTPGVIVFSGDGSGSFEHLTSLPVPAGAKIIATGDVNADGVADAVITSWEASITLLVGDKDKVHSIQLPTGGIRNPWGAAMADFDNDGHDEVVIGDASSGRVHLYSIAPTSP